MAKIRTALIGCGSISKVHLDALSHMDNVELVSVADVKENRAKARAEQYGCAYTTDWTEYVSRDDIDVVHICTPHYLHAPMAIALLDSGKRVLTEKPLASEVADAEEMIRHSDGRQETVDLPASDVLRFWLEGGAEVVVRPSGTEPKLKLYVTTVADSQAAACEAVQRLADCLSVILMGADHAAAR